MSYRFPPEIQQRLDEFAQGDSSDLAQEVALARVLVEQAVKQGRIGDATQLLRVVGNLSAANEDNKKRQGQVLGRAQVLQVAVNLVNLVADEIEGKFPGWQEALERIGNGITEVPAITDQRDNQVALGQASRNCPAIGRD